MKTGISSLLIGAMFGFGLALSGMGQPQRVIGFLDWTGAFDPTLLFVMGGAVTVHFAGQRLARLRKAPLLVPAYPAYPYTRIDGRLLLGSALFGIGWGLVGFCPAPGILSAAAGTREGLLFVVSMAGGMAIFQAMEAVRGRRAVDETGAEPAR
ncbi:MAG TPA: DUF6691 family protein [Myxococcales bacterium]|nr:DUF6691 family protein [Myxococcales bacterium]